MLVAGIITAILAGLIITGGVLKMKNAKKKSDKSNETVAYMDTQKRKTWGLTFLIVGIMVGILAVILILAGIITP